MSVRVLTKVFDGFPRGGSELLTMLALADWSDDDGRCFPAVSSIAKKVRLGERQTQRLMNGLINDGFVTIEANKWGGMPGESRRYRIVLSTLTGVADDTPTGDTEDVNGCHWRRKTGVSNDTLTVKEPSLTVQGDFEKFWSAYPKKKAKADALKAWKKLKVNSDLQDAILKAIDQQKTSDAWTKDKGQFVPYPASWLNAHRWEDETENIQDSHDHFKGAL